MNVSILKPTSGRWTEVLLRLPHDVYQLPAYVALSAEHESAQPLAVLVEQDDRLLLLPLLLKEARRSRDLLGRPVFDASSPYGYAGPVVTGGQETDEAFVSAAFEEVFAALAERDVVSLFLRLHPLLPFPASASAGLGCLVEHGRTVGIPVQQDDEQLLAGFRKGHRRSLRKAEQHEHQVHFCEGPELLDEFIDMYYENMERVGAGRDYFFAPGYFQAMFRDLPGKVHLAMLSIDGKMAQGDLLTEVNGIVQTHLGATRSSFLSLSPSVLLTFYECRWARQRQDHVLHLGGGVGGNEDSLYSFKAGFSSVSYPFHTFRGVVQQNVFDALMEGQGCPSRPVSELLGGNFPPYREPLPPFCRE